MKSICKFELKQDYEDYSNEVDMLAHVLEEDKVYLRLGRHFEFCIHADFTVASNKNVQVLGETCDLNKIAKVRITNVDTNESRVINPTKLVNFDAGDYKLDYGVYINDDKETYTTPEYVFQECPEVTYIQVDPIVTILRRGFVGWCTNLTGIMFGEPNQYPETQVFTQPYSHNDVILNNHISFYDGSNRFLQGCTKIGNVYVGDEVTGFNSCFGIINSCMWQVHNKACETFSDTYKTEIYLGEKVETVLFCNQNKINRCIISPNNNYIQYDSTVNGIIKKQLNAAGKKVIIAGLGSGYPNGYLKIPSGYLLNSYTTYSGLRDIKVIDLSEYDTEARCDDGIIGITFTGFRDSRAETLILPTNVHFIPKFVAGFSYVKNFVVPTKLAPIVSWGGDYTPWYGTRQSIYDYCINLVSNCYGTFGSGVNDKSERNLYVLDGTTDEKDSWTEQYDRTQVEDWKATDTPDPDDYDRPNMWCDLLKDYNDAGTDHVKWPTESRSPYRSYTINYLSQQQMANLINSLNPNNN